jgi:hypothetical protein
MNSLIFYNFLFIFHLILYIWKTILKDFKLLTDKIISMQIGIKKIIN